ncbi:coiled-coil domain-containing protein 69-like [Acipenser oxyrinchus oxyrinchus]|uniref:Coiled-coil domain-containing protein 69-like n=1 Tax=Acipenser oxyrinchus oxyrinchus TaxID=40147 RepID=A0AAD8D089_ACIOX|nr:coiled-coil domain-containing protein 69-like [Acipenser oxyrinchus oxyrinchus]
MGCSHSRACCSKVRRRRRKDATKERGSLSRELNTLHDGCKPQLEGQGLEKASVPVQPEQLREQHEWELRSLRETLTATGIKEREELLQTHREELQRVTQELTAKVEKEKTGELEAVFSEQIQSLNAEHGNTLAELQQSHDLEKNSLTESFETTRTSLQSKIDELSAELQVFNELKRRVEESVLKRDLHRNIQAHGSPGPFWEQELESLLFVIEMKCERIQEQGKKLLHMETLAEKNLSLEDRVKNLLQQNEDLKVRLENHQTFIKQLSREHTLLQESLEKETNLSQKLHREKEELVYRMINGNSSPTFHLSGKAPPPLTPELSPSAPQQAAVSGVWTWLSVPAAP